MGSRHQLRFLRLLLLMLAVAVGGCTSSASNSTEQSAPPPETTVPETTVVDSTALENPDADVPADYLAAVMADVAAITGVAPEEFTVLEATAVEWANQQLGCVHLAQPTDPVAVDGFRVVVDTGEAQFDYRLDALGEYQLCGEPVETAHDEIEHSDDAAAPEDATS